MKTTEIKENIERDMNKDAGLNGHALINEADDVRLDDHILIGNGAGEKASSQRKKPADTHPSIKSVQFSEFEEPDVISSKEPKKEHSNIDMILDISVPVSVELGRATMFLKDILTLSPGSIVELNKLAGDTVDLMVRGKLLARGEVVIIDDNFGIRVTSICGPEERLKNLA